MVKAQTGAQVPLSQSNLVLDVSGGFRVPAAVCELELPLRARIKLRRIRDLILQRFVHGSEDLHLRRFSNRSSRDGLPDLVRDVAFAGILDPCRR